MDNDNLLVVCRSCGRKSLMHNMRPDSSGENMICLECNNKGTLAKAESFFGSKKPATNTAFHSDAKPAAKPVNEKLIKYICTNCKYKFERKESRHVDKCPYCGKTNIMLDNALGADNLLKTSMDKKFDTW